MKRICTAWLLLAVVVPAHPAEGVAMWGCAPVGQRANVLYLADGGGRSYVKLGAQRIPARVTVGEAGHTWSFGANAVVLAADGLAVYTERGVDKARFRCKPMK